MTDLYYAAYGSNLNISGMKERCPGAQIIGKSFIDNYELIFKGVPDNSYLTIEEKKGSRVPVVIWKISDMDERQLDYYEDYPRFYSKKYFDLKVGDKEYKTLVYIMNDDYNIARPNLYYFHECLEGYRDFGLNADYLEKAYQNSLD